VGGYDFHFLRGHGFKGARDPFSKINWLAQKLYTLLLNNKREPSLIIPLILSFNPSYIIAA
jgi:hypothetical protein